MNKSKLEYLLSKAISIASVAFLGVVDKSGSPYILHLLWVMHKVRHLGYRAMILAVLHDLIEDTDWTLENLLSEGFPKDICDDLDLLTHKPEVSYLVYIARMQYNPRVMEIKLRDLEHNSKITRLKGIRDKDVQRMKKYHEAYTFLKVKLDEAVAL